MACAVPQGLVRPGRRREPGRQRVQLLKHVVDGDAALDLAADRGAKRRLEVAADDEDHLPEPGGQRVVDRVVHDRLAARPEAVDLLEAGVAAPHSGGEDQQGRFHGLKVADFASGWATRSSIVGGRARTVWLLDFEVGAVGVGSRARGDGGGLGDARARRSRPARDPGATGLRRGPLPAGARSLRAALRRDAAPQLPAQHRPLLSEPQAARPRHQLVSRLPPQGQGRSPRPSARRSRATSRRWRI